MAVKIDSQPATPVDPCTRQSRIGGLRPGMAQSGADTRQQFSSAERFGQIVVRAKIQCFDLVSFSGPGRYHYNWNNAPPSNTSDDIHSIHIWEPQIQNNQVRAVGVKHLTRLCSGIGLDDIISIGCQDRSDQIVDTFFIFDH